MHVGDLFVDDLVDPNAVDIFLNAINIHVVVDFSNCNNRTGAELVSKLNF